MNSVLKGKHIAIVAGTLGQGGAERQLLYILDALADLGAHTVVLSLTKGEYYEERIRERGIETVYVGRSPWRLKRTLDIIRACRAHHADAVASMHFFTNLYAVAAARYLGIPEMGAMRSDCFKEIRAAGKLGPASARMPRIVAANSRQAIENAVSLAMPREKFFFLPNVVDTALFSPASEQPAGGPVTLLFAGRLDALKRADRFLHLIHGLRESFDVRGIIAGNGPLRSALEQQAAGMGLLNSTVTFMGTVDDMLPLYSEADVFISCSDAEGTPNVILEAQSCGLAVAAMAAGGVADLISDGETGILIQPGDDEALMRETLRLVESPSLRATLGTKARAFIEATHSPRSLRVHLETLYGLAFGNADR